MAIKQAVLAELDACTPGHAILASNTSALSISEMALATSRPDKVVGFHFFYPASMMRLVEIVEGEDTSPETLQVATTFAQTIRKLPITCGEEPGFVVNRILNSAISEVWRLPGGGRAVDQGDRRRDRRVAGRADGTVLPHRPARARHGAARRRAPARRPTATASTSTRACARSSRPASSARRPARASTRTASRARTGETEFDARRARRSASC